MSVSKNRIYIVGNTIDDKWKEWWETEGEEFARELFSIDGGDVSQTNLRFAYLIASKSAKVTAAMVLTELVIDELEKNKLFGRSEQMNRSAIADALRELVKEMYNRAGSYVGVRYEGEFEQEIQNVVGTICNEVESEIEQQG